MKSFKKIFLGLSFFVLLLGYNNTYANSIAISEYDIDTIEYSINESESSNFDCREWTIGVNIPFIGYIETTVTLCCTFTAPAGTLHCVEIPPKHTFNLNNIFKKYNLSSIKNVEVLVSSTIEIDDAKSSIKTGKYSVSKTGTIDLEFMKES
jgi:hypothetical protein